MGHAVAKIEWRRVFEALQNTIKAEMKTSFVCLRTHSESYDNDSTERKFKLQVWKSIFDTSEIASLIGHSGVELTDYSFDRRGSRFELISLWDWQP